MTIVNIINYDVILSHYYIYAYIVKKITVLKFLDAHERKNANEILYTSSSINDFNQNQFIREIFLLFHSFGR